MKISKLSFVLGALLVSVSSYAGPKVGDIAKFEGTVTLGNQSKKIELERKLTEMNVNTGVYTMVQTITFDQKADVKEVQTTEENMLTEEKAASLVANCESSGIGKKEKVRTAAGTFDSCRVSGDNATMFWFASVPFGIVKFEAPLDGGGTLAFSASSFVHGN
jgi:hypothetical protein